jgi:hypothetical protein
MALTVDVLTEGPCDQVRTPAHVAYGQFHGDYWSCLNGRGRGGMLSEMPAATLSADALKRVMDETGFWRRTR